MSVVLRVWPQDSLKTLSEMLIPGPHPDSPNKIPEGGAQTSVSDSPSNDSDAR